MEGHNYFTTIEDNLGNITCPSFKNEDAFKDFLKSSTRSDLGSKVRNGSPIIHYQGPNRDEALSFHAGLKSHHKTMLPHIAVQAAINGDDERLQKECRRAYSTVD
jgi:hypothetical protein